MEALRERESQKERPGTLFGLPVAESLGHLSAQYPFPARLNPRHVARMKALKAGKVYPQGAILFAEGGETTGVYIILEGRVRVSVSSMDGKTVLLGFFGPGAILGLPAALLGRRHAATAETVRRTVALFVPRSEFSREIRGNATAARQAAELVSEAFYFMLGQMMVTELSGTARQKLARCLLGLLAHNPTLDGETSSGIHLSQETIAQMVGLSRETVTRVLSQFRKAGIVEWEYSNFVVRDKAALEKIADSVVGGTVLADIPITRRDRAKKAADRRSH